GVTWSTADAMTVHDRPDVTVMFDAANHTVSEGSDVTVTLRLSANPERTVVIPLTTTNQGGAGSDDHSGVPATVALRGVAEQAFSLTATPDPVNDAGESVLISLGALPSGVSSTAPTQTRVDIIDSTRTVNFEQPSYTVGEGGSVTVRVTLDSAAAARVDIPISATNQGGATSADYSLSAATVIIASGADEGTVTFTAVDDSAVERGESVRLSLGSLPAGYREGSTTETVVGITDDDVAQVAVSFGSAAYSVDEGDSRSITVRLSADPQRTVTIPLSRINQGGASGSDYSLPSTVTFNSGDTTRTVSFLATDDSVDDDGESVRLGFTSLPVGVSAGTPNETVVSIVDDDDPEVTVGFASPSHTIPEGDDEAIAVVLDRDPERRVEVMLTVTPVDAVLADFDIEWPDPGNPRLLVFDAGVIGQTFTFSALVDDEEEDAERVVISIDTPSADRVTLGPPSATTVTIDARPSIAFAGGIPGGGFGGGGGGPSGPTPSEVDYEWTVKRDIEALDAGNDWPTGSWSDGRYLYITENGSGAGDAVYAYDLETGERVADTEFTLDETNRAPRGIWSNGQGVAWVSDSGQDRLFAYDLETGERLPERDIALARHNRDARGIWSDGATIWVLNGNPSLFVYDLQTGKPLGEYELADKNSSPHGVWSDGVTVWVSDHGAKRLFAYRLPALPGEPQEEALALERVPDEDFEEPGRVGNNSPRGIWSDGEVMYVADENDDRVYTYNMPDAIDARLDSLTLEGVEIDEFDPARREYEGVADKGVTQTTVAAVAARDGATVDIDPIDADGAADGHQVDLDGLDEIAVTVTSPDGSRERVYRVRLEAVEAGPSASCLRGAVSIGFSLVVFEGGSVDDLVACAERRHVTALYVLHEGAWGSHILGAPDFVNAPFRALFAAGVPALTPLVVRSEGPVTPAPPAPDVTEPFATCLIGEVGEGFSLVLSAGGIVDDLAACAEGLGVIAVYALSGGEWVSYILAAPDFVNQPFRELFADGMPVATPLVVKGGQR
ncbi:MAG: cadherin-like beta sandwich domain-containing protein, partial [Chloroflexi bacterium]|nr:cadherin-like beta sandwich domain-containing protein [Chloroflexota bacterium]